MILTWTPVEVVWFDAHGGGENWQEPDEIQTDPAEIRTVGMLLRDTDEGVTVVLSRDKDAGCIGSYIFIPRGGVRRVTVLRPTL